MKNHILTLIFLLVSGIPAFAQVEISEVLLRKHVYVLANDSLEGRGLATSSGLKAAQYIAGYFEEIGLEKIGDSYLHPFDTYFKTTNLIGNNVVGLIEGNDSILKNEYIVLGAHYDHISFYYDRKGKKIIYNGADDNASGTSGIIELGRALNENRHLLKRSVIIVAFDGEESGLLGSKKLVNQNFFPIDDVKLMMSIDMIGRLAQSESITIGAIGSLDGGYQVLDKTLDNHRFDKVKTGKKISNRTDSGPFGKKCIPALYISTGIVGPYHEPEDDAITLDYSGMKTITEFLYDFTIEISDQETLEPSKHLTVRSAGRKIPRLRFGAKLNLGRSHHSYYESFYNGKRKFSFETGVMAQLKITKNIALQPEVLYSSFGSGYSGGNYRTNSFSVPISLVFATNTYNGPRLFFSIGAYYTHHFSGEAAEETINFGTDFSESENGLTFGFGIELKPMVFSFDFKYGQTDVSIDPLINEDMRSVSSYFSIGFLL